MDMKGNSISGQGNNSKPKILEAGVSLGMLKEHQGSQCSWNRVNKGENNS